MPGTEPSAALFFELTVRPETPAQHWHAELLPSTGPRLEFTTPLDLLRHLAELAPPSPSEGGLR